MKIIIKAIMPKKAWNYLQKIKKQIKNFRSLAKDYGQWQTIRDSSSIDQNGQPIPWYTYPTIEYLSHLDMSKFSVFEYGSGNSTLWWASRVKRMTSVENNEDWFMKIKKEVDLKFDNVNYLLKKEKKQYVTAASKEYDIFIIDGAYRSECVQHIANLQCGPLMIILDNADRDTQEVDFLQKNLGWLQVDFHGFGPINDYSWITSIFINPKHYSKLMYKIL